MSKIRKVLIIDDDPAIIDSLSALYRDHGFSPFAAQNAGRALELVSKDTFELILLDLGLPDMDGLELFKEFKTRAINAPVIIVSGQATIARAIEATRLGAFNVIEKPPDPAMLLLDSQNAVRQHELETEVENLRRTLLSQNDMIGESAPISALRRRLRKIALSDSRVYIEGEPGAGKEMAARYLHFASPRAAGPFVAINCAAIPGELFESELFGHERGAFTGAVATRKGKFEIADGGSLFLDEVAELRPEHQAKLLRAIESSAVQRLGSTRETKVDVRIISASNKNLRRETDEGRFREDLYFRLNVIPVSVPPLRERFDDIPLLTRHFLDSLGYTHIRLEPGAFAALSTHDWPGNVRELRNIIERAAALVSGDLLDENDIRDALRGGLPAPAKAESKPASLKDHIDGFEKSLLEDILRQANGNIAAAARMLQMDRGNLSKRLKKYGLTK